MELQEVLDFVWWRKEGRQFSTVYLNLCAGLDGESWMGRVEGSARVQSAANICAILGLASMSIFRTQWIKPRHSAKIGGGGRGES